MDTPPGYVASDGGVWLQKYDGKGEETLIPIMFSDVTISERIKNVDDDTSYLKLCFHDSLNGGELVSHVLKQSDALSKKGIMELVGKGALFDEGNARDVIKYLSLFLNHNKKAIVNSSAYPQLGWFDDSFIFGDVALSLHNGGNLKYENVTIIGGDDNVKEGISCKNSINVDEWVRITKPVLKYKRARFMCYVGASAPLLNRLDASSYGVHNIGETSTGKTALNQLALSLFGDPRKLLNSGNVTINYAEEYAQFCKDMPVCFDEAQMVKKEEIVKLIYMLANETGKGRASVTGGTRKTRRWKTVGLTSGENTITYDSTYAGADVRVIQLFGGLDADDEDSAYAVNFFKQNIKSCYGSVGQFLIHDILRYEDQWVRVFEQITVKFNEIAKTVEFGKDMRNVGNRMATTFGVICTAGFLFENTLSTLSNEYEKDESPDDICVEIFKELLDTMTDRGYGQKAFDSFISWLHSKQKYFTVENMELSTKTYDYYGEIKDEYVDVLPTVFKKEFCEKNEFELNRILKDWKRYGWIETEKGRNTITTRLNGQSGTPKVIRVKYSFTGEE